MKYLPIGSELFRYNRNRFARKMTSDSIAIFHSNDLMPRSGDTYYTFRQNSSLFYLSGIDQPETVVVLFPDCIKEGFEEVAFIRKPDDQLLRWEGDSLSTDEARHISGIDKIYYLEDMDAILRELILLSKRIYVNLNESVFLQTDLNMRNERQAKVLQQHYPAHKYHRAGPLLKKLMMIKSQPEVDLVREAIRISDLAFRRLLPIIEPGIMEYEVEAELTYEILRHRANGHAYPPIIASGKNATVLHYQRNDRRCQDGELLLLDFGAEYANYACDISRTVPVSGQFTDRQRNLYLAVMRVLQVAQETLTPGTSLDEHQREVGKAMESELLDLGLIDRTDIRRQSKEAPVYKRYFMHGTSHHLGLDVHDLSNPYEPLQAGMLLTCEPGIYLPEEGIGIRLENDILVTDDGPINLCSHLPIEPDAIEEMMNAKVLN